MSKRVQAGAAGSALLLRVVEPDDSPFLDQLDAACQTLGVRLLVSAPHEAADSIATDDETILRMIGPGAPEPLQLVRRARSFGATGPIYVVTASRQSHGLLQAEMLRNPFLQQGTLVVILDELTDLTSWLGAEVERAQRQQRHDAAVARIERQLAGLRQRAPGQQPGSAPTRPAAASDEFLANILAQAPQAILSTDVDGTILTWNVAAENAFGYSAEEIIGHPLSILDAAPPSYEPGAERLSAVMARVIHVGAPEQTSAECRTAAGTLLTVSASLAPIRDTDGHLHGVSVMARSVSEPQPSAGVSPDIHRQMEEFLAIISHELRTPLTSIIGYTDMLLRGLTGPLPPRTEQYLGNIRAAGGRLLDLINGLLDFTRLESGAERLNLQPVEVEPVLRRVMDQVRESAKAKSIAIHVLEQPGIRPVLADHEKIEHVLCVFLNNAVKFTPEGGSVRVEVGPDPQLAGMARIAVSDTGVGLDEAQVDRVWDRFYQADSSLTRAQGGIGLGLTIAKQLAVLHGGQVGVESAGLGRGSTFWLSVPFAHQPS